MFSICGIDCADERLTGVSPSLIQGERSGLRQNCPDLLHLSAFLQPLLLREQCDSEELFSPICKGHLEESSQRETGITGRTVELLSQLQPRWRDSEQHRQCCNGQDAANCYFICLESLGVKKRGKERKVQPKALKYH